MGRHGLVHWPRGERTGRREVLSADACNVCKSAKTQKIAQ
jgi:hypothetical protein